ncbi:MAG: hypothetical protein LBD64_05005 [Odoribacteraceae bacterium]|jgi:hypothetical protein|nr:hypothetical protein [Odoribacteraceae bacterium]
MKAFFTRAFLPLLVGTIAWNCTSEPAIIPEGPGDLLSSIPFPQGDDPWDKVFKQIHEQHDVKIFYKDFSDKDWNRTWTNATGAPLSGERFETPEELNEVAAYVKKYIFDFIDPNLLRGVFRPHVYLIKNMKLGELPYSLVIGMNSWVFSPPTGGATDYSTGVYASKIQVLSEILYQAVINEMITLPDAFREGVDYQTATVGYSRAATDNNWNNLWCRRGFLSDVTDVGLPFFPDQYATMNVTIQNLQAHPEDEFLAFVHYILILRDRDRYFASGCRFENSPLLQRRFNILEEHLKTVYGIDLAAYQTMAYEGYSGSEWDSDRCVPRIP